jgi:hypothetical protein
MEFVKNKLSNEIWEEHILPHLVFKPTPTAKIVNDLIFSAITDTWGLWTELYFPYCNGMSHEIWNERFPYPINLDDICYTVIQDMLAEPILSYFLKAVNFNFLRIYDVAPLNECFDPDNWAMVDTCRREARKNIKLYQYILTVQKISY